MFSIITFDAERFFTVTNASSEEETSGNRYTQLSCPADPDIKTGFLKTNSWLLAFDMLARKTTTHAKKTFLDVVKTKALLFSLW
jgi:hypothetical protein